MDIVPSLKEQKLMRNILQNYPSILVMSRTYTPELLEETVNKIMKEYQIQLIMEKTQVERQAAEAAYVLGYIEDSAINYQTFTYKILYKDSQYMGDPWFMDSESDEFDEDFAKFDI
jgi:hypothetical protein